MPSETISRGVVKRPVRNRVVIERVDENTLGLGENGRIFYDVALEMPATRLSCVTSGSEMGEFIFVWQTSEDASRSDETS
jgi:hypothetical protein